MIAEDELSSEARMVRDALIARGLENPAITNGLDVNEKKEALPITCGRSWKP